MANKVAIITGSSRGIGKAIAWKFAENGFDLVINSKKSPLEKLSKEIKEKTGNKTVGVKADLTTSAGVSLLFRKAFSNFKKIDVLVNNAGVYLEKPITKTTEKDYDYIIDSNLKSTFLCCLKIIPKMIQQKSGTIINISSIAGKNGYEEIPIYCASKFGQIGITESLSEELKKYKIRVLAICPGAVATDMQRQYLTEQQYQKEKDKMIQPEEIADLAIKIANGKFKSGAAIEIYE